MEIVFLILLVLAVLIWVTPTLLRIMLRRLAKRYMGIDLDGSKQKTKQAGKSGGQSSSGQDDVDERPRPKDGHKIFGDDEGEYISYTDVHEP